MIEQNLKMFAGLAAEQKYLTTLYENATDCIPVLLDNRGTLPMSKIYAPLLIEEDLGPMKWTQQPNKSCGTRPIKSMSDMFRSRDKLPSRMIIKGEAGSGKTVLCLKLVESWCQLKQSGKERHTCERESKLISKLKRNGRLPELLHDWHAEQHKRRSGKEVAFINVRHLFSGPQQDKKEQGSNSEDSDSSGHSDNADDQDDSSDNEDPVRPEDKTACTTCELQQCLSEFDLLYYVPLRDTTEGKTSVVDLVCDTVCNNCQDEMERTKRLLSKQSVRCLIILDGLDEWPNPPGFTGIPDTRGLSLKCVLLLTMRPWKLVHLQLKPNLDTQRVTVCGLSSYSIAKVIENILHNYYGKSGKKLESKFLKYCKKVGGRATEGLMRMPMMLVAACHLWYEQDVRGSGKHLGSEKSLSMTHLYLSLLEQMIKDAASKQTEQGILTQNPVALYLYDTEKSPPIHPGLPAILRKYHHITHFISMLLPFCELAFTDLVSADTRLIFDKGQLERNIGRSQVNLAQKLGLISQTKVGNIGLSQNVSVSFYHKSVQELLAAMHLTCDTTASVKSFFEYCSTIEKVMEMGNLTLFWLGLNPSVCCDISKHIMSRVNNESQIKEYRQTLDPDIGERVRQLYRVQCQWQRELRHCQTLTDDLSSSATLEVGDVYLNYDMDMDTVRLTEELMRKNPNSIVSVWMWHVIGSVLQFLPNCPNLSALCITCMGNEDVKDVLGEVIPILSQLDTLVFRKRCFTKSFDEPHDAAVANAIMRLTTLKCIELHCFVLGDYDMVFMKFMTRLQTMKLHTVFMSSMNWDKLITSLRNTKYSVHVEIKDSDIDKDTVRRIQTSPDQFKLTILTEKENDSEDERDEYRITYKKLVFTTEPSHRE